MNRGDLKFKFTNPSTGLFKDQLFNEIEAIDQREQVEDLADNTLFYEDDAEKYIRQGAATGTSAYTVTVNSPTPVHTSMNAILISFDNTSDGAVTLNTDGAGFKKVYKDPTTQAGAGDITQNAAYLLRYHGILDGGAGGWIMVTGGGPSTGTPVEDSVEEVVDSTGDTITLDFDSTKYGNFSASTIINAAREVVLSNATRAQKYDFNFEMGTADISIDFGPNAQSTHALFAGGVFTPQDVGLYLAQAVRRYGTDTWLITFSGVYSVGDALPEPPDPGDWVIGSGIWNDTAVWKDTGIWKDS